MDHRPTSFTKSLAALLCLLPLIAVLAPRALAFTPAVIGLIGVMGYRLQDKSWPRFAPSWWMGAGVVTALISASVLWGYDPEAIKWKYPLGTAPILLGTVLLSAVLAHRRADFLALLGKMFPYACLGAGLLLLADLYAGSPVYLALHDKDLRPGNLSHLNRSVLAFSLCSLAAFGSLTLQEKPWRKTSILPAGALLLTLLAVAARTDSQSAQLGLMVGAACLFLIPYSWRRFWIAPALALSALLLATPFLTQWLFQHIAPMAAKAGWLQEGFAAARMEIWDFISRRALERPWLGHGIETTRSVMDFDIAHIYQKENTILHPHNFAVQIWIDFGLLGAVIFAALFSFVLFNIWQNPSINGRRFQFSLLVMLVVTAAISYGMWQGWWVGLIGFIFAFAQLFLAPVSPRKEASNAAKSSGSGA